MQPAVLTVIALAGPALIVAAAAPPAMSPAALAGVSASRFAGTWKGRLFDQPAVDLRLKAEGTTISGVAVFYQIDPGTSGPGTKVEVPLRDAKLEKGVLSFGVKRDEDGGITRMQMTLRSDGEAELKTLAESLTPGRGPQAGGDPTLTLKKE